MKIKTHLWDGLILFLVAAFLVLPLSFNIFLFCFIGMDGYLPTGIYLNLLCGIFSDGALSIHCLDPL